MFTIRKELPEWGNPFYNNSNAGGYSWCITCGHDGRNVLKNCVGYACGRFNEIYSEITGYDGMKYPELCHNAERFYQDAIDLGLEVGQTPQPGAIIVWGVGNTSTGDDGCGHVAVVEQVLDADHIMLSHSEYSGDVFNYYELNSDNNWGIYSDAFKLLGFIYNPAVPWQPIPGDIERDPFKDQVDILATQLRTRTSPNGESRGIFAAPGLHDVLGEEQAGDYNWLEIEADVWIAENEADGWTKRYPAEAKLPEPVARDGKVNQVDVHDIDNIRYRKDGSINAEAWGKFVKPGIYNVQNIKETDGYTWYNNADGFWFAHFDEYTTYLPKEENCKAELDKIKAENKKLQDQINSLNAKITELNTTIKNLNEQNNVLKDKLAKINELSK